MKQITWYAKEVNTASIDPTPTNYKIKTELGLARFRASVKSFGRAGTVVCNPSDKPGRYNLIDGNTRWEDAVANKEKRIWVSLPSRKLSPKEFKEMSAMFDFAKAGEVDMDRIKGDIGSHKDFYDKYGLEVPLALLDTMGAKAVIDKSSPEPEREVNHDALREKFIEPPFSVLDTKQGAWQDRKADWLALGIQSELGREGIIKDLNNYATLPGGQRGSKRGARMPSSDYTTTKIRKDLKTRNIGTDGNVSEPGSVSVFDPCLSELMYTWFCPTGGAVLDPFAGGSVRGIVANYLGFKYYGIDLSERQLKSNREQALRILKRNNQPQWYCGDSDKALSKKWELKFDFIFSCPPYVDLEVYSDHPDDISTMKYDKFLEKYSSIIKKSLALLKPARHACFVVGEVRDKNGYYYDFVGDTKRIFMEHGAKFLNDAVLLNAIGSAPVRAGKFDKNKKLIKVHQNVLTFYKP